MGKRANGEGTIYKLPNGKFRVTISIMINGKLKRLSKVTIKKADAVVELKNMRLQGVLQNISNAGFVGRFLRDFLEWWMKNVVPHTCKPTTVDSYQSAINKHINPRLGDNLFKELTPIHIQTFVSAMINDEVGGRARQIAFETLRAALNDAVTPFKLLSESPCEGIATPKHEYAEIFPFEIKELKAILEKTKGTRWHALIALGLLGGMRQGELFGLRLEDVDFEKKVLHVRQQVIQVRGKTSLETPKSKKSVRTIAIPDIAVAALKEHLEILDREKAKNPELLVFPAPEGGLVSRGNFNNRVWIPLLKSLSLEHRGFHHCRHTYATVVLSEGAPLPTVSNSLGHANQAITLNTYSHSLPSQERSAAIILDRLLA